MDAFNYICRSTALAQGVKSYPDNHSKRSKIKQAIRKAARNELKRIDNREVSYV